MECNWPHCLKRFANNFTLQRHVKRCHTASEDIPEPKFECDLCQKQFNRKDNFLCHWKVSHEGIKRPKKFVCDTCGKSFSKQSLLLAHWKKFHAHSNVKSAVSTSKYPLKCALCHLQIESTVIIKHYTDEHNIDNLEDYDYLNFKNDDSFHEWKKSVEKSTVCKYVKAYSSSKNTTKFICHRSGEFKSKSVGIRNIKTQGSKKINGFCPAHMYKMVTADTIHVRFAKIHIGHGNDLCHLQISPSKKMEIASKLVQKIPKRDILNDVRDSYTGGEIEREHLLTLKDIYNISQKYNLEDYKKDKIDGVSVNIIVDQKKSCVLYYKPQDTIEALQPLHAVCSHINGKMSPIVPMQEPINEPVCEPSMINHEKSNAVNIEEATLSSSQCNIPSSLAKISALHNEILGLLKSEEGYLKYVSLLQQNKECISLHENNSSSPSQFVSFDRPNAKVDPKEHLSKQKLFSTKNKKHQGPRQSQIPTDNKGSSLYYNCLLPPDTNNVDSSEVNKNLCHYYI